MNADDMHCDVLIVGGGLVGSALALALAELPLRVVLAESHDVNSLEQPGFDARATALANATRQILGNLSVWHHVAREAEPITRIHVSERERFGASRIDAAAEGVSALGYTIENRDLGAALWEALRSRDSIEVLAPARYTGVRELETGLEARVEFDGVERIVRTRVIVAADGVRSGVRASMGIGAVEDDYRHTAVIFNCLPRRPLSGLAIERFTRTGPLAVLPLPGRRGGVVWSTPTIRAAQLLELDPQQLAARLDEALGGRLGPIDRIGERAAFPLRRIRANDVIGNRIVFIGSAAVNVHPVAGQGFNLAMRDIACLAEVFADELIAPRYGGDIGAAAVLQRYASWRRSDQVRIAQLTHGLVRLFELNLPGAGVARGLGLLAFDLLPGAKRSLARIAMGRSGRAPRLVCGQPLYAGRLRKAMAVE